MARAPAASGAGAALSRAEKIEVAALYAVIAVATLLAFVAAFTFLPRASASGPTTGLLLFTGLGLVAYILGLRHGFDADHIAAIDNTTRKLLNEGKRPLTVGTWFSLGHSTIVAGLVVAFVFAAEYIQAHISDFARVGAVVGTLVSGVFLVLIGLVNLVIVLEVYRIFRGLRRGELDERALEAQMEKRGFLYRYFGRLFRLIEEPWQIYPIGVLFGLGFDTATEVALIAIAVGVGLSSTVPIWVVLLLPVLFTCGMVLSDTTDGVAMRYAYGWAFLKPIRKVYYNLTLTVISVLVAFGIAGIELLQVLALELGLGGPFWRAVATLDFEWLGVGIVVLFVGSWAIAMAIYRWRGYEAIGSGGPPPGGPGGGRPSSEG
jgi:high-affinity nickel-transport protein